VWARACAGVQRMAWVWRGAQSLVAIWLLYRGFWSDAARACGSLTLSVCLVNCKVDTAFTPNEKRAFDYRVRQWRACDSV
jgi:hypothetical protein